VNLGATLCRKRTVSQRNTEAAQGNTEKKIRVELIGRISREPVEKCRHKVTERILLFLLFLFVPWCFVADKVFVQASRGLRMVGVGPRLSIAAETCGVRNALLGEL
jgi:hypothetical protein